MLPLLSPGDADALLGVENGKDEGVLLKKFDAEALEVEGNVAVELDAAGNSSAHVILWPKFPGVLLLPMNEVSAAANADWKLGCAVIAFVAADTVSDWEGGIELMLLFFCM